MKIHLLWALRCMDCIPVLTVKLGTRDSASWTERVIVSVVTVVSILYLSMFAYQHHISDIYTFSAASQDAVAIMTISSSFWYIMFKDQKEKVIVQDFFSFDHKYQTGCKPLVGFYTIFVVLLQLIIWVTSLFHVIYIFHLLEYPFVTYVALAVTYGSSVQLCVMKHLLNKRLKTIKAWIEEGDDAVGQIFLIRELIYLNSRINMFFSTILTNCLVFNLWSVIRVVAGLWIFFHLNERPHYTAFGTVIGLYNLQLLLLVLECSSTSVLVKDLQWEIDRVISNRRSSLNRRKKLLVFLQELHHSPTVFTCMDLFTAEPSSVTVMCGLVLNALMVFVQFMHE